MQIVIDIDEDLYTRLFDNGGNNVMDMRRACVAIRKGIPLSEIKDRWKRGYERLYQEKMDELNTRKKELECELNMSIVQDHCRVLTDEITICCNDR